MRWLTQQGHRVEKRHGGPYGKIGTQDLDVLVKVPYQQYAVPLRLELKTGKNKPTKIQEKRQRELREAGAAVGVAWTLDEVKDIVRELCHEH